MTARTRRRIDIRTGDYVQTGGKLEHDDTIASTVILALRTRKGSCAVLPWYGSRIFQIKKLTRNAPRLVERYAVEALKFLVERRMISGLVVAARAAGSALEFDVTYRDRSGVAKTLAFAHPLGTPLAEAA